MKQRLRAARGWKLVGWLALAGLAGFVLIQAVPYGRQHSDPTPTKEARWSNPQARAAFNAGCADCHSDHTNWRWYSNVAPASWLIQKDVNEGRGILNLSEWDKPQPELGDIVEQISSGGMPPLQYKIAHSEAKLSAAQKRELIAGFRAMYATDPPVATKAGG